MAKPVARVTIQDVAEAANVSASTASRALSGRRRVGPETERAVLAASEKLGYRVNTVARALRMQTTATMGMVVPGIGNPYFPGLVEAVERDLFAHGTDLLLGDSQEDTDIEAARVTGLIDRRIDGLLLAPISETASSATVVRAARELPVVQIDRHVEGAATDFVGTDNAAAIQLIIDHLVSRGCRTFAYIGAHPVDSSTRQRQRAFEDAVSALNPSSNQQILVGDYSLAWGREGARRLADTGPLPSAIVCGADIIALGAISALRERGIRVPRDVAVTGVDDISFAEVSDPPLTTVRQPTEAIAQAAVALLRARLAGDGGPTRREALQPTLIVRASTP